MVMHKSVLNNTILWSLTQSAAIKTHIVANLHCVLATNCAHLLDFWQTLWKTDLKYDWPVMRCAYSRGGPDYQENSNELQPMKLPKHKSAKEEAKAVGGRSQKKPIKLLPMSSALCEPHFLVLRCVCEWIPVLCYRRRGEWCNWHM